MKTRRFLAFVLVIAMVLGSVSVAFAASGTKKGTATTITLEKYTGSVTITNASGKEVKPREGAKLYSGYTIKTGKKSSANLLLDDKSALLIESSSKVQLNKSGKKIAVMLMSGTVLDVSEKLAKDQTLDIYTTNMVTGVRGTVPEVSHDSANDKSSSTTLQGTTEATEKTGGYTLKSTKIPAGYGASTTTEQVAVNRAENTGNQFVDVQQLPSQQEQFSAERKAFEDLQTETQKYTEVDRALQSNPEHQQGYEQAFFTGPQTPQDRESMASMIMEMLQTQNQEDDKKEQQIQQAVQEETPATQGEQTTQVFEKVETLPESKTDTVKPVEQLPQPETQTPATQPSTGGGGGSGGSDSSSSTTSYEVAYKSQRQVESWKYEQYTWPYQAVNGNVNGQKPANTEKGISNYTSYRVEDYETQIAELKFYDWYTVDSSNSSNALTVLSPFDPNGLVSANTVVYAVFTEAENSSNYYFLDQKGMVRSNNELEFHGKIVEKEDSAGKYLALDTPATVTFYNQQGNKLSTNTVDTYIYATVTKDKYPQDPSGYTATIDGQATQLGFSGWYYASQDLDTLYLIDATSEWTVSGDTNLFAVYETSSGDKYFLDEQVSFNDQSTGIISGYLEPIKDDKGNIDHWTISSEQSFTAVYVPTKLIENDIVLSSYITVNGKGDGETASIGDKLYKKFEVTEDTISLKYSGPSDSVKDIQFTISYADGSTYEDSVTTTTTGGVFAATLTNHNKDIIVNCDADLLFFEGTESQMASDYQSYSRHPLFKKVTAYFPLESYVTVCESLDSTERGYVGAFSLLAYQGWTINGNSVEVADSEQITSEFLYSKLGSGTIMVNDILPSLIETVYVRTQDQGSINYLINGWYYVQNDGGQSPQLVSFDPNKALTLNTYSLFACYHKSGSDAMDSMVPFSTLSELGMIQLKRTTAELEYIDLDLQDLKNTSVFLSVVEGVPSGEEYVFSINSVTHGPAYPTILYRLSNSVEDVEYEFAGWYYYQNDGSEPGKQFTNANLDLITNPTSISENERVVACYVTKGGVSPKTVTQMLSEGVFTKPEMGSISIYVPKDTSSEYGTVSVYSWENDNTTYGRRTMIDVDQDATAADQKNTVRYATSGDRFCFSYNGTAIGFLTSLLFHAHADNVLDPVFNTVMYEGNLITSDTTGEVNADFYLTCYAEMTIGSEDDNLESKKTFANYLFSSPLYEVVNINAPLDIISQLDASGAVTFSLSSPHLNDGKAVVETIPMVATNRIIAVPELFRFVAIPVGASAEQGINVQFEGWALYKETGSYGPVDIIMSLSSDYNGADYNGADFVALYSYTNDSMDTVYTTIDSLSDYNIKSID